MNIGITGNIGSGKTTICKIFETLDIPVYYADDMAKKLMVENPHVKEKIKLLFGLKAYSEEGRLDTAFLGGIVFNNPQMLSRLNYIVHPAVAADSITWAKRQKGVQYTLKEAALLIESESHKSLDKLIVVTAPLEMRIERVMKRDGVTREEVLAREDKQMSESEKVKLADFVIINNEQTSLVQQVQTIHNQILSLI